jgi:hypothetical protein
MRKWIFILVTLGALFFLGSCNAPKPDCAIDEMVAPVISSPAMWGVVDSLTPTLTWTNPGPCNPSGYTIRLMTGPFFDDEVAGKTSTTSWTVESPLQPATEYAWAVNPFVGETLGPVAGRSYFFTGPMCAAGDLLAPTLLQPDNGSIITELNPSLIWDYPGNCLPQGYSVQLSNSLNFDGSPLNGGTGNPSTRWSPGHDLVDCQRYFWRIRGMAEDIIVGPNSPVFTFRVDTAGTCGPESSAMIRGVVWRDTCGQPELGPIPDPPPVGCISLPGGGIAANGVQDPWEDWKGIEDVVVRLSEGACPSAVAMRDVPTLADGTFAFYMVNPGTYCVSVDSLNPINTSILIPGGWSAPAGSISGSVASQTVTVAAGDDNTGTAFGWDDQYEPGWGYYGFVSGIVWHDLCSVQPGDPIPAVLPDGCVLDGSIVHADGIRQPGEPGIAGIVVDIGFGDCPSSGLVSTVTDAEGHFSFPPLPPLPYCININAEDETNASILLPGRWTKVPSGHMGYTFWPIALYGEQVRNDIEFGWDYDDLPAPGAKAAVSGVVWHDLCSANPADPVPAVLPSGCAVDAWGVVHADGIRQPGEPGIPGVEVTIGNGPCPSSGLDSAITDANGAYSFSSLPSGKYCIAVPMGDVSSNHDLLMPGSWTVNGSGHEGWAYLAVGINPGTILTGNDFGWDYDNLPSAHPPYFKLHVNAFCRRGPDPAFEALTSLENGLIAPVEGVNNDLTWYLLRLPGGNGVIDPEPPSLDFSLQGGEVGIIDPDPPTFPSPSEMDVFCWVMGDTGSLFGDLISLPVHPSPPTPTPVPDTSGPSITDISTSETPVYYPITRCGATTLTITAKVEDPSGVKNVTLTYRYKTSRHTGAWRTVSMTLVEGVYSATIDVGSEALPDMNYLNGTLDYKISAGDNLGNESETSLRSVTVLYCK